MQGRRREAGGARKRKASEARPHWKGVPGYGTIDPRRLTIGHIEGDAEAVRAEGCAQIVRFLQARNVAALLAKTGEQLLMEAKPGRTGPGASNLEQAHVELLQAFALAAGRGRLVPGSPHSMLKLWGLVRFNAEAYLASITPQNDADALLARRVRIGSMFYRNVFNSDDAKDVVPALTSLMDPTAERELGYKLSDLINALFSILDEIWLRLGTRAERARALLRGAEKDMVLADMLQSSMWAQRIWRPMVASALSEEDRGLAGWQLAEMLCEPLFTFRRDTLVARFGEPVAHALFNCSLTFGDLSEDDLARVYLDNPIWKRPFIALDTDTLFLPVPALVVSFPFSILEGVIGHNQTLQSAYSAARARYLEDDVERVAKLSLPSGFVHRGVKWTDPDTGVTYEHDVVAVVGMQVLVFEAKSGKLASAARRGGLKSLKKNFEELFVEPGKQGARLESLLASRPADVKLVDRHKRTVMLDPSGPSIVYKFSVCMEQFTSVTSSRRLFQDHGLLGCDQAWAPVLTLAELRMISDRLDTEVSFLHYLTRRSTVDDVFDFIGDEQDLLSMYLTNGFAVEASVLHGQTVMFLEADAPVRERATPRSERRVFDTPGMLLPPIWRHICKEVYDTGHRNRFDILITIMNQRPGALSGMANRIKRWRSGVGGKAKTFSSHMAIGRRVFAVVIHLAKELPSSGQFWSDQSRLIGSDVARDLGVTDCVVILSVRRSDTPTFNAISFFRFLPSRSAPSANPDAVKQTYSSPPGTIDRSS